MYDFKSSRLWVCPIPTLCTPVIQHYLQFCRVARLSVWASIMLLILKEMLVSLSIPHQANSYGTHGTQVRGLPLPKSLPGALNQPRLDQISLLYAPKTSCEVSYIKAPCSQITYLSCILLLENRDYLFQLYDPSVLIQQRFSRCLMVKG